MNGAQALSVKLSGNRVLIGDDAMTVHSVAAKTAADTTPTMAQPDARGLADLDAAAQTAALWCRRSSPDPRSTISAMWASSLVWAAENLADMFSTTVKNVKRSR